MRATTTKAATEVWAGGLVVGGLGSSAPVSTGPTTNGENVKTSAMSASAPPGTSHEPWRRRRRRIIGMASTKPAPPVDLSKTGRGLAACGSYTGFENRSDPRGSQSRISVPQRLISARRSMIRPVVAHAEAVLARRGLEPLPAGVTAHKLRHTFASILFVRGEDPPYIMAQLGHTDPAFTLRVYAHAMRRGEGDKEALKALVEGRDWAPLGTSGTDDRSAAVREVAPESDESPADAGLSYDGRGGFRTCDLSRVKRALSH
jgi:hypothetical protein